MSPPLWLLDDGPFGLLAGVFDAAWTWPEDTIAVVREVADSAPLDKSERRDALLKLTTVVGGQCVRIHDGGADAAAVLWGHLRPDASKATRDLGEDASIAVCAAELPAGVFVTMDKRAAYVALAELGRGRVCAPFELWDALERAGQISLETYRRLCEKTARQDQGLSAVPRPHQR